MNKVNMIQVTPHKWVIKTVDGFVLKDDIVVHSVREAEDYVRSYVSSFTDWGYNIITLNLKG